MLSVKFRGFNTFWKYRRTISRYDMLFMAVTFPGIWLLK